MTEHEEWKVSHQHPLKQPSDFRVTDEDIDRSIQSEWYHVVPGTTVTICALTTLNGFTVIGHSACIDPANFDAELGREIVHTQARDKLWELMGYALMDEKYKNTQAAKSHKMTVRDL